MTEEQEEEQQEEQEHENKRIRPRERALGQKMRMPYLLIVLFSPFCIGLSFDVI